MSEPGGAWVAGPCFGTLQRSVAPIFVMSLCMPVHTSHVYGAVTSEVFDVYARRLRVYPSLTKCANAWGI